MRSFNEIYEEIYKENYEEFEKRRKGFLYKNIGVLLVTFLYCFFVLPKMFLEEKEFGIMLGIIVFSIVTFFVVTNKKREDTKNNGFKEQVTEKFIKNIAEGFTYSPHRGIEAAKYSHGFFDKYDRYHSSGYVEGMLDGKNKLEFAEVLTTSLVEDEKGNKDEVTSFYGIFESLDCNKSVSTSIAISTDKADKGAIVKFLTMGPEAKVQVQTDSTEFEEYFDVFSFDPIETLRILTADVMQIMVDFRKQKDIKFEVTIKEKKIYIRFFTVRKF